MAIEADKISEKVSNKLSGSLGTICDSNESIIKNLFGGAEFIGNILDGDGGGLGSTLKDAAKKTFEKDGQINYRKIAGSYIGASSAYRLLSGGGIYKDRNGNTDIIGIPFV